MNLFTEDFDNTFSTTLRTLKFNGFLNCRHTECHIFTAETPRIVRILRRYKLASVRRQEEYLQAQECFDPGEMLTTEERNRILTPEKKEELGPPLMELREWLEEEFPGVGRITDLYSQLLIDLRDFHKKYRYIGPGEEQATAGAEEAMEQGY